jgi:hypothetical protein
MRNDALRSAERGLRNDWGGQIARAKWARDAAFRIPHSALGSPP